jgi:hypothetical protein
MFKDKLIGTLEGKKMTDSNDKEKLVTAINKIQKQKRLSSQEFLSIYDSVWKKGPTVQYQNPDERVRHSHSTKEDQNPKI